MKLKDIGRINYETAKLKTATSKHTYNEHTPDNIWAVRCPFGTPTDFRQDILTMYYGRNFIDKSKKVLEIGFGCGRNAQFFLNETSHIKYYGFDTSQIGMEYFEKQGFPKKRYHVSLDIDETILSQKYDLIFSTFVFHHIGFSEDQTVYDAERITHKLFPLLKSGGYWVSYEGRTGDNQWNPDEWLKKTMNGYKSAEIKCNRNDVVLKGSAESVAHRFIVVKKGRSKG